MRLCTVAALCVGAVAACTGTDQDPDPSRPGGPDPSAAAPDASGSPRPAGAFDLTVEHITVVGLDNAEIRGVAGAQPNDEKARQAVTGARDTLATFLDAQFVAPQSRFSGGPIDALLTPAAHAALTDEARAGLGQMALPVSHTVTGPAAARAQVLVLGDAVDAVTLTFDAALTIVLDDDTHVPVTQSGSMTFLPTEVGWRADAVEVTTDLPEGTT